MQITFDVVLEDGKHRCTTMFADILALEDKFDIDASILTERQRATWMAFLAWRALTRSGETQLPFDAFKTQIQELSPADVSTGKDTSPQPIEDSPISA